MIKYQDRSANEGGYTLPSANIGKPVRPDASQPDTRDENFPPLAPRPNSFPPRQPDDPGETFDASSPAYRQGWLDRHEWKYPEAPDHPFLRKRTVPSGWVFFAGLAAGAIITGLLAISAALAGRMGL